MEPWKLGVIALLIAAIAGYGIATNGPLTNNTSVTGNSSSAGTPLPAPTPSKYVGKTLPPWPTIKQWVNTPSPINLSAYKGSPVFVEVFRTECPHCQDAAPYLVQLHKRYAPRGLKFVGIQSPGDYKDPENPENNWTGVQNWLKNKGYTWPVGFDEKSAWFQGNYGKGVFYPSMFLIDANGKIVFFQSGHDGPKALELAIQLEKLVSGAGDVKKRASDLAHFLAPGLGLADKSQEDSLAKDLATRLDSAPSGPTLSATPVAR